MLVFLQQNNDIKEIINNIPNVINKTITAPNPNVSTTPSKLSIKTPTKKNKAKVTTPVIVHKHEQSFFLFSFLQKISTSGSIMSTSSPNIYYVDCIKKLHNFKISKNDKKVLTKNNSSNIMLILEEKINVFGGKEKMKILIGALFLSLWQSLLFWKQDLGISVLLFTIPIIWITTKLLKGNIKNKKALLISIPIIVLSSTYFIFDNLTFYLINIVLIPILYLIMIIWAISDFQIKSIIYKIILMIFEPLNYIGDVIKTVLKEFNPKEKDEQIGEKKEKNNIFKAVCFTGIIALIVIGLLCSADNEFAKIFSTIFKDINIFNVSELTGRIIIIIIAFFYFAGFFMNMLDKENGLKEFEKDEKAEKKESYTIRMMITVLNLVYLVFCFTQIKVLFTEQNIKYSEFARKGFFQLMIVSLINIVMILKANNKNLRENEKQDKYKKTMCIVMVIFTLVIIISAFARMTLYQQNYGYTRLRVLVDLTLITEIILLIPTVIYILENKINLIKTYFVIIVTMYCIVNFVNIDKFIVKNNINRYKETGNIDLNYLIEMNNTDLVEQLLELDNTEFKYSEKLYSQSNIDKQLIKEKIERQKKMLDEYLTNLKKNLNETYTVAEFNLPKMRAKSILNNRK